MKKMKKLWQRTTKEVRIDQINPKLTQAIHEAFARYEMEDVRLDPLICIETDSKRLGGISAMERMAGIKDKQILAAAVVTPVWLIYATSGDHSEPFAFIKYLKQAMMTHSMQDLSRDMNVDERGVNVTAQGMGALQRSDFFIGLGPEPVSERFENVLKEAIKRENPQG